MAKKRPVSNLMALAVLAALRQNPMHPYEMGQTLRSWDKGKDMGLKWGSLYTVVRNLDKHGLVEAVESNRQGARPERTVYRITDAGEHELLDWARELVSTPEPERRRFTAGLSVLSVLGPDEAIDLLRRRLERLDADNAAQRESLARYAEVVPRLFLVEDEYELALAEAEATWVRGLLEDLTSGTYPGLEVWATWHETGEMPPEIAALAEGGGLTDPP